MKLLSMRSFLVVGATVAAGIGTAAYAFPASASPATPVIVTCTGLKGSGKPGGTGTLSGCNNLTITGGGGITASPSTGHFTVKWKNGKTTSGTETYTFPTPSKCPLTFKTEAKTVQKVTGGTATPLIGGTGVALVCVNTTTLQYELLPGTTDKF